MERQDNPRWITDLQQKMEGAEMPLPPRAWEDLSRRRRRRRAKRLALVAAAVAAAAAVLLILLIPASEVPVITPVRMVTAEDFSPVSKQTENVAEPVDRIAPVKASVKPFVAMEGKEAVGNQEIIVDEPIEEPVQQESTSVPSVSEEYETPVDLPIVKMRASEASKWAIGLSAMSTISNAVRDPLTWFPTRADASGVPYQIGEKWHSTVPLSFALTVAWRPADKLLVETGLTYTWLKQEKCLIYSDNRAIINTSSTHFLGIPIKVGYEFLSLKKFHFYALGGCTMDIGLNYRRSLQGIGINVVEGIELPRHPVQWSVNLSVGAEYRLSELVGIYIEPGLGYYFKPQKGVDLPYNDYPWNFQARAGLRFNLGNH